MADCGISGTSAKKRDEFQRLLADCRKGRIDRVLCKSISRFARNTVDCLNYIRVLRELGIAVIFEKENINTLEADSEMLITILGAFAQAESESISANVRWGKRQAMRDGKAIMQYKKLYAYQKGEDGQPEIIPEQAVVVQRIYDEYLAGASFRMIKNSLEADKILSINGSAEWTLDVIKGILTNEKYCGDVLLQKTYTSDCISKKTLRNTGQLPMYLLENHHVGIIDRQTFDTVQAEMARRNAGRSPSKKSAPTGRTSYASKYALSERLVCGECGTLYRRCTWVKRGRKRTVWRCVSRLDYGTKYCHDSPTLDEKPLQRAVLTAISKAMSSPDELIHQIVKAMEKEVSPLPGQLLSLADIERGLADLETQFNHLLEQAAEQVDGLDSMERFQAITQEIAALKQQRTQVETLCRDSDATAQRLNKTVSILENASPKLQQWDETVIRQFDVV